MERQRERARAAHKFAVNGADDIKGVISGRRLAPSEFVGYKSTRCKANVVLLSVGGKSHEVVVEDQQVDVVLDRTPFYAEMGGQVADTGEINGRRGRIAVKNTVWAGEKLIVHRGVVVQGSIGSGEEVTAAVNGSRRLDIARNHTATHLLHAALRKVCWGNMFGRWDRW
jgi:alanyl-tRNA synthetase